MSQLAIVGNTSSEGEVVIKCLLLSGLAFFRSNNITMKNLKIVNCGALQNNIGKHVKSNMQSAIFVNTCNNIQLIDVDVINSNGTGIALYNPSGVVHLDMCDFINNSLPSVDPPAIGGGGLVIEADDVTANYDCMVMNSTFLNNTAKSRRLSILSQASNPSQYFGLGGGITIVFREGTVNNTVQLAGVRLENNIAQFGGGLYLAFFDSASGNYVTIDGIEVANNTAMLEVGVLLPFASGGGISIDFASSEVDFPFNNTVEMLNSKFLSNTAQLGGGIAVDVVYDGHGCVNADNKLLIENCSFDNNEGYQGSSAYFSGVSMSCQALLNTKLSFINFTRGHCAITSKSALPCLGSVLLKFIPIAFKGALSFSESNISALGLIASSIELLPSTKVNFSDNFGFNGAALHVVDCSSVIVNDNTSIYFENNNASNYGGAIYTETCTQTRSCFIRHSNSTLDPDEWKTNVTFIKNQANGLDNSIYAYSIESCVWSKFNKNATFCWKGWSYEDTNNSIDNLRSGPSYISFNGPTQLSVYPGECINLKDFTIFDDWDHNITYETNLQVSVLSSAIRTISYYEPNCLCNNPLTLEYHTTPNRSCEHGEVAIYSDCENDYMFDTLDSQILIHPPHQSYGIVLNLSLNTCDNGSECMLDSDHPGLCFRHKNDHFLSYKAVCNGYDYVDFDNFIICGNCVVANNDDFGLIINAPSFTCSSCNAEVSYMYLLFQILLVMIMMTILAVLHINITNGNLNAYILYSQMVTLQFPGLGYIAWLPTYGRYSPLFTRYTIPLTVYSIWNLNFLTLFPDPFCIRGIRTAVGVILLQYVTAACPLLFIIVSYTWIQCYNNGYGLVVYTTRPVHRLLARFWQKFKIKPSLIDTYAGLLLLAYMRFLAVSVKLLMLITFDSKFASSQVAPVPLVVIPILCLLVFVILPMAVLLLYPFKIFQRCLTCCRLDRPSLHAIVDAYQGCFKNSATDGSECRYFAGLYLLLRFSYAVLVFSLSLALYHQTQLFLMALPLSGACLSFLLAGLVLILRPYKKPAHNIIDFLIFCLMSLFAVLSGSTYQVFGSAMSIFINESGPLYLPFLCLVIYIIYRIFKCCCCCACVTQNAFRKSSSDNKNGPSAPSEREPFLVPPTTTVVGLNDYADDDEYPDRIVNPGGYT